MFAPVADRGEPGLGFTHQPRRHRGDRHADAGHAGQPRRGLHRIPPWDFGAGALMRNLAARAACSRRRVGNGTGPCRPRLGSSRHARASCPCDSGAWRRRSISSLILSFSFFMRTTDDLIRHRPVQLLVDEVLEVSVLVAQAVDVLLNGHWVRDPPRPFDRLRQRSDKQRRVSTGNWCSRLSTLGHGTVPIASANSSLAASAVPSSSGKAEHQQVRRALRPESRGSSRHRSDRPLQQQLLDLLQRQLDLGETPSASSSISFVPWEPAPFLEMPADAPQRGHDGLLPTRR